MTEAQAEETKAPRSKEEITKEYEDYSAKAGDLGYRIAVMKEDQTRCWKRMFELNQEVARLAAPAESAE